MEGGQAQCLWDPREAGAPHSIWGAPGPALGFGIVHKADIASFLLVSPTLAIGAQERGAWRSPRSQFWVPLLQV